MYPEEQIQEDNYTKFTDVIEEIKMVLDSTDVNKRNEILNKLFDIFRNERMCKYELISQRNLPVVIHLDGGLIQDVNHPYLKYAIIYDHDIEGVDDDDLFVDDHGKNMLRSVWELQKKD